MKDLILSNAKIFTEGDIKEGGIAIDEGKIFKIAKEPNLPPASKEIDCNGNLILPGIIDVHVHLRDLDLSYKEDFLTGTRAALAGGITTVLDMPNTKPRTDTPEKFKLKLKKAANKIVCNAGFYSAIPENFQDILKITKLGAMGFKIYPDHPYSNFDFANDEQLDSLFKILKKTKLPIVVHAEKKDTKELIKKYKEEKYTDIEAFLKAHDFYSETSTVDRCINLIKQNGIKLHFAHISTSESVRRIIEAKSSGINFSLEITPHHLILDSDSLQTQKTFSKMVPPLRKKGDRDALWDGINSGFVDIIATDHAPHSLTEKKSNFLEAPSGIPGLETLLPLMLTHINKERITLAKFVELSSRNPAKIFNLQGKGKLSNKSDADLVVVDLKEKFKINSENFFSKAHHSPFDGFEVQGIPIMTILNGELVMDHGEILAKAGTGSIIKPQN
ncbi:MAG: dihydroorotase family protein [Candidatus Helarchaeota archaeon]|nr:dihydroorotase family protein [Candidatus Helarchaeota archaeon]